MFQSLVSTHFVCIGHCDVESCISAHARRCGWSMCGNWLNFELLTVNLSVKQTITFVMVLPNDCDVVVREEFWQRFSEHLLISTAGINMEVKDAVDAFNLGACDDFEFGYECEGWYGVALPELASLFVQFMWPDRLFRGNRSCLSDGYAR